jgi:hypothetical protein
MIIRSLSNNNSSDVESEPEYFEGQGLMKFLYILEHNPGLIVFFVLLFVGGFIALVYKDQIRECWDSTRDNLECHNVFRSAQQRVKSYTIEMRRQGRGQRMDEADVGPLDWRSPIHDINNNKISNNNESTGSGNPNRDISRQFTGV